MRLSCILPVAGPMATRENLRRLAQLADRSGYDTIWVGDHVVIPRRLASRYPYSRDGAFGRSPDEPYYEPTALIAYLAGATDRVRLGTSVIVLPYRNPILLAKTIASIDDLSGGRVTLGVGVGWLKEEFEALGLPDDYFPNRGAIGDEWIQILRTLWTETNPSFAGRFHRFADIGFLPKPAQRPHPPIVLGGLVRPALRRAARLADGWQAPDLLPEQLGEAIADLRRICEEEGRDPATLEVRARISLKLTDGPDPGRTVDGTSRLILAGPPGRLLAWLEDYRALGVQELAISFAGGATIDETAAMIDRFAAEVLPKAG